MTGRVSFAPLQPFRCCDSLLAVGHGVDALTLRGEVGPETPREFPCVEVGDEPILEDLLPVPLKRNLVFTLSLFASRNLPLSLSFLALARLRTWSARFWVGDAVTCGFVRGGVLFGVLNE
jgi:hypothetical protein